MCATECAKSETSHKKRALSSQHSYNRDVDQSIFSVLHRERWEVVPRGIPLIIGLRGFSDAGNAVDQLIDHLLESDNVKTLAEFSNDAFLDYRARRPTITFVKDHLVDYEPDRLALYLCEDQFGEPFLFLAGYEPDFQWERFIDTVETIVDEFRVSVTTWVHAIPMPVPHTRPIGTTISGSLSDLIKASSIWQPTTRLSSSIGHALEHRLYHKQYPVAGFVLLVPHYLANTEYPQALLTTMQSLMDATGLLFSTGDIVEKELSFRQQVDEQIRDNEESVEMVMNLEHRYDQFLRDRDDKGEGPADGPLVEDESDLPSAEQLAEQLEDFLAEYWGNGEFDQNTPPGPSI